MSTTTLIRELLTEKPAPCLDAWFRFYREQGHDRAEADEMAWKSVQGGAVCPIQTAERAESLALFESWLAIYQEEGLDEELATEKAWRSTQWGNYCPLTKAAHEEAIALQPADDIDCPF